MDFIVATHKLDLISEIIFVEANLWLINKGIFLFHRSFRLIFKNLCIKNGVSSLGSYQELIQIDSLEPVDKGKILNVFEIDLTFLCSMH